MNIEKSGCGRLSVGLLATFATFGAWACTPVMPTDTYIGNGVYCLDADLVVSRNPALTLTNNGVLDCQGHKIKDATSSVLFGVMIMGEGDNIVLKNCAFEGFAFPIYSVSISNLRILNNSFRGTRSVAILAGDMTGLVQGNTFNISGSGGDITAVSVDGTVDVIGNTIVNEQMPAGSSGGYRAAGISASTTGGVISDNLIRNLRAAPGGYGVAIASQSAVISGNVVVNPPGTGDRGIVCNGPARMVSNLVVGFATPYTGCLP